MSPPILAAPQVLFNYETRKTSNGATQEERTQAGETESESFEPPLRDTAQQAGLIGPMRDMTEIADMIEEAELAATVETLVPAAR